VKRRAGLRLPGASTYDCAMLRPPRCIRKGFAIVPKGTVKWYNDQKGYGFIAPEGGGKDVFVHISAVERAGLNNLNEGQIVEFEEVANKGKTAAENLKVQR
jgi:CspA family cold shock protein